jgi:hypothetical protein
MVSYFGYTNPDTFMNTLPPPRNAPKKHSDKEALKKKNLLAQPTDPQAAPKIRFINAITDKPIKGSYLPLDTYKIFKA